MFDMVAIKPLEFLKLKALTDLQTDAQFTDKFFINQKFWKV